MSVLFEIVYLICAVGFIIGLRKLSDPRTARVGNLTSFAAMAVAIIVTLFVPLEGSNGNFSWIIGSLVVGGVIGWISAKKVQMTEMPQLVSIFNGLGGGSAMLLAGIEYNKFLATQNSDKLYLFVIVFTLIVGAISFSGSILAYLKLDGKVQDKHVMLPKHTWINIIMVLVLLYLGVVSITSPSNTLLIIVGIVSLVYGFSFVAPIGGADMPVVISLLNSITGISAAFAGFLYGSQIMILGGILVGASGTVLTLMMCAAMNRSIWNVIVGGFGSAGGATAAADGDQVHQEATAQDVAIMVNYANKVLVVPGYGMAVSQAQKQAKDLDELLAKSDVEVYYGIHPVAGRMPGHMNVILAEVDISYDKLLDLEESNDLIDDIDIVLVVGANDVVNPSALDDKSSSIYGMPVLEVWRAKQVIVFKRSMNPGYAGIQNPLFFRQNTKMLFGDAGASLKKISEEVKNLS
jgi:NAD(P) transhydrogenase subunit beta